MNAQQQQKIVEFNPLDVPRPVEGVPVEEALLGGLLSAGGFFLRVSTMLEPSDFHLLKHNYVFGAMQSIFKRNEGIDYLTVANELQKHGQLDAIGGYPYLTKLANDNPNTQHIETYGLLVKRLSKRRQLLEAGDNIRQLALQDDIDFDRALGDSRDLLMQLQPETRTVKNGKDVIMQTYDAVELALKGNSPVLPSGLKSLDALSVLKRNKMIVVGGRPGMGKSALLLNIALHMAKQGLHVYLAMLEMGEAEIGARLISIETGISSERMLNGQLTDNELSLFTEATARVGKACENITFNFDHALTADNLWNSVRLANQERPVDTVLVDYIGIMTTKDKHHDLRLKITDISQRFRWMKEQTEVKAVWIVASQLNRSLESRPDKRPQLNDLKETGALEENADAVIGVYRDEVYNTETLQKGQAELIVLKHRGGRRATAMTYFDDHATRFRS